MDSANPMDRKNDFCCVIIDIGDHFMNDGAHHTLLEPGIGRRRRPNASAGWRHASISSTRSRQLAQSTRPREGAVVGHWSRYRL